MAISRRFIQCDVFSPVPTQGNGLAVVIDGDDLTDSQLQGFAAWTNLAETTFLLTPTEPSADYRVRIFTPAQELPFAGHPTLGSCAAWLHAGGSPLESGVVRQECGIGIVDIDVSGERLAFVAPPTAIEPMPETVLVEITGALDISPESVVRSTLLDNGPQWQVLQLAGAEDVLSVDSSKVRWPTFDAIGLIGAHPAGGGPDYEVRMLAPSSGMSEDPITGSLNAALAFWLREEGLLTGPLTVAQGTAIGRSGRVYVQPDGSDRILIGGDTTIMIEGTVTL
ncbi:MAG: PhzF family phenazine biosynthesis protein [Acidimicrobiia bacterium]